MSSDSPSSPLASGRRRRKGVVRGIERCCSRCITSVPLVFVYGLTTWAIYVEITLSLSWAKSSWLGYLLFSLGIILYGLLNWSYTVASFTDPGSPTNPSTTSNTSLRFGYSYLPTREPSSHFETQSLTVKSSGGARYCKKCQTKKPDRAHHCSTCGRCVLKMDHHCPWLATCVGFKNYKPFLLFCTYVTLFCWLCFGVSGTFLWTELLEADMSSNAVLGINTILLVVLSGIFGLVLTGFTGWHISLAWRNQTTIECLEKTRYLSPIRKSIHRAQHVFDSRSGGPPNLVQRYGQQLTEMHANAIPGVTRSEEGEDRSSRRSHQPADSEPLTAMEALRLSYDEIERERERQRYEDYLDEQDSEKLPNAFDLGWKKNLLLLFGDQKFLWLLPICNTIGDGWHWEPSSRWITQRERLRADREAQYAKSSFRGTSGRGSRNCSSTLDDGDEERYYLSTSNGIASFPGGGRRLPSKANQILGRSSEQYADDFGDNSTDMPLRILDRRQHTSDTSSIDAIFPDDENVETTSGHNTDDWRNWH